ncbi:hypothetical protein TKK_0015497 [Trichogramma kaykai]
MCLPRKTLLLEDPSTWPPESSQELQTDAEQRTSTLFLTVNNHDATDWQNLFEKFSSLHKIVRILAYTARFQNNATKGLENRTGYLTAQEMAAGQERLWRIIQYIHFRAEIDALSKGTTVSSSSPMKRLNPFIAADGLLCVGGRLERSLLAESEKHPIILPSKDHVVRLLVHDTHLLTLHGGPLLTHSTLGRKFWVLRARNFIRGEVRKCTTCARYKARTLSQAMGSLPPERVQPTRPFTNTGVDYAGPIWYKASPGRGRKALKGYLAVFVCMTTTAAHLEVVSDYSTSSFLAAFRRFVSRRGLCRHLFSDNGTNFRGADAELKNLFRNTSPVRQKVAASLGQQGIEWHFTPPYAPNFGGLWEATVKSCKGHLKRVIGENLLTYEELITLVIQIEGCLNSRPLGYLSSNEEDPIALTPGHFLIGSAIISLPDKIKNAPSCLTAKWELVQKMRDDFWARWSQEHLT